jgi:hypothetical protein
MNVKASVDKEANDDWWDVEAVSEESLPRLRGFLSMSANIILIPLRRSTELPRERKDMSESVGL